MLDERTRILLSTSFNLTHDIHGGGHATRGEGEWRMDGLAVLLPLRGQRRIVATTRSRQLLSDTGAFADWAISNSSGIRTAGPDDLSLGFNAGPTGGGQTSGTTWPNSARPINYGIPPEMGMVGLRDVFVVAPAAFNHHHQHHEQINLSTADPINASNATALGVGVIPLLTAAPCLAPQNMDDQDLLNNGRNKVSGIHQFWQNQGSQYIKKASNTTAILDHHNNSSTANFLLQSGNSAGNGSGSLGGNSSSSATTTCQDCGNQAKKDCSHRRCRTCCKSRGFDCVTHVKSTWVPAARRRERQLMSTAGGGAGSTGSTSGLKKPRLISSQTTTSHTSTSNTTRSYDTSSSHQDAGFKERLPGQVTAPATFRCVRVTAVEDGEDEFAYQAVVKIGGHVFKGFLYDQGVETRDGFPNISELHLGGGSSSGNGIGRNGASSPILDPSDVYGASAGGLLGGSGYGNPIN
ncbi:hypothetical protein OIU84_008907 [Salix udensis]|uniref:Uncharacterized protein n=1 Tax=Salix udensis TaxID=889485 RepID=A0AAD6NY98_9ROSI|nr:hypothetical protein OIU84_008907 [Salix udensis]